MLPSTTQYNPVLVDIIMSLVTLFANILSQNEDPADSVPTDDDVTEGIQPPACMILWAESRFLDDIL